MQLHWLGLASVHVLWQGYEGDLLHTVLETRQQPEEQTSSPSVPAAMPCAESASTGLGVKPHVL